MRYSEQLFDPAEKGYDQNYFNEDFPMQHQVQLSRTPDTEGMKELIQ